MEPEKTVAEASTVVFSADTTPPVFGPVSDITAEETSPAGAAVSFVMPTVTDADSGIRAVSCDRQSGEVFSRGGTVVHCQAVDNADNRATTLFTVSWLTR